MVRRHILPLFFVILAASAGVAEEAPDELDWSAWQRLPVFHDGRMMPLDSFARLTTDVVCGRAHPKLSLDGVAVGGKDEPPGFVETRELFPDGRARKFTAAELLFSWIVEPQRWENAPFLWAANEDLREDWLGVPVTDLPGVRRLSILGKTVFEGRRGKRFKHVSPRQVQDADQYWKRLMELSRETQRDEVRGRNAGLTPAERGARKLYDALAMYRLVTFDPTSPVANRSRFQRKLAAALRTFSGLQSNLEPLARLEMDSDLPELVATASGAAESLAAVAHKAELELSAVEPSVVAFRRSTAGLAERLASHKDQLYASQPDGLPAGQIDGLRANVHALASATAELARQANEVRLALYDNGVSLRLVPGLNPAALENSRNPDDDAQPWVNLQTLLAGSDDLLADYPPRELHAFRAAFGAAADAYVDRRASDRAQRFAEAMDRFAASVRRLGEAIEPIRRSLPLEKEDEELVALTAYPAAEATAAEVHYQRLNPFLWSWLVSLAAMAFLGLAFGAIRKPMFWLGILALVVAQGFTIYGLGLRVAITGWAPVTNMFETVIFVAMVVGLLGLWFVLYPMFGPGLEDAWRMTAVPGTFEAAESVRSSAFRRGRPAKAGTTNGSRSWWNTAGWVLFVPRLALAAAIFTVLTLVPFGSGEGYMAVSLVPRTDIGSSIPTLNDVTVWAVGMGVLLLTLVYLPRAALTLLLAVVMVPRALVKQSLAEPVTKTLARKPFAVAGASVALFAALVAYYAPISGRNISPLMPVLRDNFWLTLHVLSITASYGAGALAWGLGNMALGHYLFGRYRDPADDDGARPALLSGPSKKGATAGLPSSAGRVSWKNTAGQASSGTQLAEMRLFQRAASRRPPVACDALGTFTYKAVQVAVLLLATGTILGALWADVSWGRFWGWDPKEVWALVSTLVYLAMLHGRYAGWFGSFGMAVAGVLGASSIMMAWYGVNRLDSGLHAYASVQGGVGYVVGFVAANWAFLGAAAIRYFLETRSPRTATQESTS